MDRYHHVQARLEARLAEIGGRLDRIEHDLRRAPDPDWTEQATLQENDEVLAGLDDLERAEAAAIRRTLRRIASGQYGVCVRCGRVIAEQRLVAVPTADTCIDCADQGDGAS